MVPEANKHTVSGWAGQRKRLAIHTNDSVASGLSGAVTSQAIRRGRFVISFPGYFVDSVMKSLYRQTSLSYLSDRGGARAKAVT